MLKRYVIVQNLFGRYCFVDRTAKLHSIGYSDSLIACLSSPLASNWGIKDTTGIINAVIHDEHPKNNYTIVYNSDTYPSIETTPELFI